MESLFEKVWSTRTSKLLRGSLRTGTARKLKAGLTNDFDVGIIAASRAASGSTDPAGKIFVGWPAPSTPIGNPQNPEGLAGVSRTGRVRLALKISPTKVGL